LLGIVLEKGRSGAFEDGLVDGDPAFLEVARLVVEHIGEVGAERWWGCCGGLLLMLSSGPRP
jgi:hypothetical protein